LETPTVASLQSPSVSSAPTTGPSPNGGGSTTSVPSVSSAPTTGPSPNGGGSTTSVPSVSSAPTTGPSPNGGGSGKRKPPTDVSGNPVDKPIPSNSGNNRRSSTTSANKEKKQREVEDIQKTLGQQAHKANKEMQNPNYVVPAPATVDGNTDSDPSWLEDPE
jgi:hypothetical protein